MTIELRCECGQRLSASQQQAGKRFTCPKCSREIRVPGTELAAKGGQPPPPSFSAPILAPPDRRTQSADVVQTHSGFTATSGIGTLLLAYFMIWTLALVATFAAAIVWPTGLYFMLGALGLLSVFLVYQVIRLFFAKPIAMQKGEAPLLAGLLKLIAWNPTEGIVILRNKQISFVDDNLHDGGGVKLIYPVLGAEVAMRAPLEPQSLIFEDADVMTREYLPLTVKGTIKWRIVSLQHFYLLMSTQLQTATDAASRTGEAVRRRRTPLPDVATQAEQKLAVAVEWLRWIAEEETRGAISLTSAGLLAADRVAAELPHDLLEKVAPNIQRQAASAENPTATEGLAATIFQALTERVNQYGIEVHQVSLQEIRLPLEIHQQCVEACKASYIPLIAHREAQARQLHLKAEAEVLGADAVAAREVIGAAPRYTLGEFLSDFVAKSAANWQVPGIERQ